MSLVSKTFAGSLFTPSGDAAVVGSALKLVAATSYFDDFESYGIGVTPTGMIPVGGTATVESSGGQKVMRVFGAGWAGVYYSPTNFGDGCFEAEVVVPGGRVNTAVRFNPASAAGYPVQFHTLPALDLFSGVPTDFVGLNIPSRVHSNTARVPTLPYRVKLQTSTRSDGNINVGYQIADDLMFDYQDDVLKWVAGKLALQVFIGATDYGFLKFWPKKTGGFSFTAIPNSVTSLKRIIVEYDNEAARKKKTSEVFEYRIDAGAFVPVPDDGLINLSCSATIQVRAVSSLVNDFDSTKDVAVNAISIEIDGAWELPPPPPGLPAPPTNLAAVPG